MTMNFHEEMVRICIKKKINVSRRNERGPCTSYCIKVSYWLEVDHNSKGLKEEPDANEVREELLQSGLCPWKYFTLLWYTQSLSFVHLDRSLHTARKTFSVAQIPAELRRLQQGDNRDIGIVSIQRDRGTSLQRWFRAGAGWCCCRPLDGAVW